jgi:hypothetical protein
MKQSYRNRRNKRIAAASLERADGNEIHWRVQENEAESAERRARARAIRKIDRELVDLSYQRIDLSYDLLRVRVHGLPPG